MAKGPNRAGCRGTWRQVTWLAKKNRERNEDVVSLEIIEEPSSERLTMETRRLLEAARLELEDGMRSDMRTLEATLARRLDAMATRLQNSRAEIARLHEQTASIKNDPLNEIVRNARARLSDV